MAEGIIQRPVLAVDPGMSGAIALYDPVKHQLHVWCDFKSHEQICAYMAGAYVFAQKAFNVVEVDRVIEFVHSMPGQGVCSVFSFGKSTGVAIGSLYTLSSSDIFEVSPQRWQTWVKKYVPIRGFSKDLCEMELYKPKFDTFDSRVYAVSAFPDDICLFKRAKDHNSADAALMALYRAWYINEIAWEQRHAAIWETFRA